MAEDRTQWSISPFVSRDKLIDKRIKSFSLKKNKIFKDIQKNWKINYNTTEIIWTTEKYIQSEALYANSTCSSIGKHGFLIRLLKKNVVTNINIKKVCV